MPFRNHGKGIVEAVAPAAHAGDQIVVLEKTNRIVASGLRSLIGCNHTLRTP